MVVVPHRRRRRQLCAPPLLVSSYLPEVGQSLSSFSDGAPAPFRDIQGRTFGVRPDALAETFLQDCDPDLGTQAMTQLPRQSRQVAQQPVQAASWQQVPSTSLVCTPDPGTPPSDSVSSLAGPGRPWSSTRATTPSFHSQPRSGTWC